MYNGNDTMSALCPVIAFDKENKLFLNDDETVGYGFVCMPLSGGNEETKQQLEAFLALDFPVNTTISFMLFRSPDIDSELDQMILLRSRYHDALLTPMLFNRVQYLREHTEKPLVANVSGANVELGCIVDVKLFITVKIPVANGIEPTEAELVDIKDLQRRSYSSLNEVGFMPSEMTSGDYLRLMGTLVNWGKNASWRQSYIQPDPDVPLCEQFYDNDTDLDDSDPTRNYISLGQKLNLKNKEEYERYVQVLSPRVYPSTFFFGDAMMYAGDPSGRGRSSSITGNYAMVSTLRYVNHVSTFDRLKKKRAVTGKAQFAPVLLKARPELGDAIHDNDEMYNAIQEGGKLIQYTFSVIIFAKNKQSLIDTSQAMQQYLGVMKYKMMVDRYIQREMFTNCLPFCCDRKFMFGIEARRFHTFTTNIASVLLPIFSEWKGTGTGHIALISRIGQLMTLSLQDSQTNNNALIAAESGSGKSFYTNELMSMYMSEGARVWIIDIGRSYLKLCNILHGEFIVFDPENLPCMNPFKMIKSITEEHDSIIAILMTMISPNSVLTDTQISILTRVFDEEWEKKEHDLTIDDLETALFKYAQEHNSKEVENMAVQLYSFTSKGPYGAVYNGGTPINFTKQFTVLELEELNGMPNLRQVILLQLIFQIQQAIFLSPDRSQKKLVMIDEAWDLLKQGQTATFMEAAYRKFRKYGASAIIATQSVADLYNAADNKIGQAIAANSAFYFLLGQKEQTIEQVKKNQQLALSEGGFQLLKTVRTVKGAYSEIFIQFNNGAGIGRLIVSDFEKLMFSTDARDIARINKYVQAGATYSDAINQILVDDGKIDYKDLNKQDLTPYGRIMNNKEMEEYLKLHGKVVSDAEIRKYENAYWSPLSKRLIFSDGSNVINPRSPDKSVGVITDGAGDNPLVSQKEIIK